LPSHVGAKSPHKEDLLGRLVREPYNDVDCNAVQVWNDAGPVGYIDAALAAVWAPILDSVEWEPLVWIRRASPESQRSIFVVGLPDLQQGD
jgi:hypothetical protein